MNPEILQTINNLRDANQKANRVSDQAASYIREIESMLTDSQITTEAEIEVSAFIKLKHNLIEKRSRILVGIAEYIEGEEGPEELDTSWKPWAECDRTTKLLTSAAVPKLLEEIAKKINTDSIYADNATAALNKPIPPAPPSPPPPPSRRR